MEYYSEGLLTFFCMLTGAVAVMGSLKLPMFEGNIPAAGIWPVVLGSILVLLCLGNLAELKGVSKSADKTIDKDGVRRLLLSTSLFYGMTLIMTEIIGLLPTLSIYLAVSLYIWYELKPLKAAIIGVCSGVIVFLVFTELLSMQFPWGLLENLM